MAVGVDIDLGHRIKLTDLESRLQCLDKHKICEWKWNLTDPCVLKYKEIFNRCQPSNSIVHSLIIATLEGNFGYFTPKHLTGRIGKNIVNLNPRVCTAFIYPLEIIANGVIYLDKLNSEMNTLQVDEVISEVHYNLVHK